jgi:hypothetical protein
VVRPHFIVRLLLAENHPDASGDLLLSTTLESTFVTQLDHRNFPRTGLTHLAHSPQPVARALVALDRDAPAELIERLSHDDDIIVTAGQTHLARAVAGRTGSERHGRRW